MQRLMDLRLPMSVVLGETRLLMEDLLKLTPGSILELDHEVNEYVDVTIHGTVVARGEIVSVKGNYGIRIKELISQQDRMALKDAA